METIIGETIRDILKANAFAKKRAFDLLKDKKDVLTQVFQEFDDKSMIQIRSKLESLLPPERDDDAVYDERTDGEVRGHNKLLTKIKEIIRGLE